ncbi:MAG: DUF115 domain-containing protein [Leptospiraceae bacterium]|nr:DUF115 domain-containing protein [Leptospiraceae bacterium]
MAYEPFTELKENKKIQTILKETQSELQNLGHSISFLELSELNTFFLKNKTNIQFIVLPFYNRNVKEEFEIFSNLILKSLKPDTNKNTKEYFSKIWLKNYAINIQELKTKEYTLLHANLFDIKEKLVLFIGASPELEDDIPWILQHQKNIFIISSDTSSYYLYKNNIYPDLVISIDSGRGTALHFREDFPSSIPILTWIGGNPEIFKKENPLILYFSSYPLDQTLAEILNLSSCVIRNPSLNIAGLAKALSIFCGAKAIAYSGVSFLSKSFQSHCKGTGYENFFLPQTNRKHTLESISSRVYNNSISKKNTIALNELRKSDQIKTFMNVGIQIDKDFFSSTVRGFVLKESDTLPLDKFLNSLKTPAIKKELKKELHISQKEWKKLLSTIHPS